jgi:hypothetical protein
VTSELRIDAEMNAMARNSLRSYSFDWLCSAPRETECEEEARMSLGLSIRKSKNLADEGINGPLKQDSKHCVDLPVVDLQNP